MYQRGGVWPSRVLHMAPRAPVRNGRNGPRAGAGACVVIRTPWSPPAQACAQHWRAGQVATWAPRDYA